MNEAERERAESEDEVIAFVQELGAKYPTLGIVTVSFVTNDGFNSAIYSKMTDEATTEILGRLNIGEIASIRQSKPN
jgi:hypothetical protein